MLRCAEGATNGDNVLIVLAAPLPLRAHPKGIVVAGATTTEFIASVASRRELWYCFSGESIGSSREDLASRPGACRVHQADNNQCSPRCLMHRQRHHQQRNANIAVELSKVVRGRKAVGGTIRTRTIKGFGTPRQAVQLKRHATQLGQQ